MNALLFFRHGLHGLTQLFSVCIHQIYPRNPWLNKKRNYISVTPFLSGYQDSNLGPPAPKAGALTGLRYIPNHH